VAIPEFADEASADLESIVDFIAKNSLLKAESMLQRILETCQMLAENPGFGEVRDGFGVPGCRSYTVSRYFVFFRPSELGVETARIIDGSRDL